MVAYPMKVYPSLVDIYNDLRNVVSGPFCCLLSYRSILSLDRDIYILTFYRNQRLENLPCDNFLAESLPTVIKYADR